MEQEAYKATETLYHDIITVSQRCNPVHVHPGFSWAEVVFFQYRFHWWVATQVPSFWPFVLSPTGILRLKFVVNSRFKISSRNIAMNDPLPIFTCRSLPMIRSKLQRYFARGRYFLTRAYWGCAAGWGRIFTTGLTIMGISSRFRQFYFLQKKRIKKMKNA